jgi:hypothetical protein
VITAITIRGAGKCRAMTYSQQRSIRRVGARPCWSVENRHAHQSVSRHVPDMHAAIVTDGTELARMCRVRRETVQLEGKVATQQRPKVQIGTIARRHLKHLGSRSGH